MIEIIPPTTKLNGSVKLPGSKSITNRALLLAALADGESRISGALKSDDTKFMAAALRKLGIKIDEPDDTSFIVFGRNGKLAESAEPLFLGNAGTAVRFLTAAATLVNGETIIDGDARMRERPIGDLVDALRQLGVKIEFLGKENCPPLRIISDGKIKGDKVKIRADISSQFLSAIMMIAPLAENETQIQFIGRPVSKGYLDLTESAMIEFGQKPFQVKKEKKEIFVSRNTGKTVEITNEFIPIKCQKYLPQKFSVDADSSSATYFWAAEKLLNQKIEIENFSQKFWQPDSDSKKIIDQFPNLPSKIDGSKFPDAIPTLAVLAAFSKTRTIRFFGIANLRIKECDRIAALVKNLNKIKHGLAREYFRDELIISGTENLADLKFTYDNAFVKTGKPVIIETFDDHRIAMSFFLAGLKIPGIKIDNPDCVSKSFPNFWEVWESLGVKFLK